MLSKYSTKFLALLQYTKRKIHTSSLCVVNMSEKLDPQQELLLKEQCILVDKEDKRIGPASKKACHLMGKDGSPPPLHRAFSVFLFNTKNELLLQQRSDFKITFPLFFTNTCCSHPLYVDEEMNESDAVGVKMAAYRRVIFELGIPKDEIKPSDFKYLTRIYYSSPSLDGKWGEHEIDYILFMKKDVSLKPNFNEVKEIKYVSKDDFETFLTDLKSNNIPVTPWFQMIIDKFLPKWWDNLNNLDKFIDHESIHSEVK